jgi:probable HAF family extracellular repeat protein
VRTSLWSAAVLLAVTSPAFAGPLYTYTTIDVPGATNTEANGINSSGQIVGQYVDSHNGLNGFLLNKGVYTTLDGPAGNYVPNASANGINALGQIVGYYVNGYGVNGFLYRNGAYTTIAVGAGADAINNLGQIVGTFLGSYPLTPFLLSNGTFTILNTPASSASLPLGINDSGQIVGFDNGGHGFLLKNGSYTTFEAPGGATVAAGINDSGQIVGNYLGADDQPHGFLLNNGVYTTFDVPGATRTVPFAINDSGQIVGEYVGASGYGQGFLATPAATAPQPPALILAILGVGSLGGINYLRRLRRPAVA